MTEHAQTVQAKTEPGQWMFIADAVQATGLSEKTLRRYLKKKLIRGRRLGKAANAKLQFFITEDLLRSKGFVDWAEAEEIAEDGEDDSEESIVEDFSPEEPKENIGHADQIRTIIEECVRPLITRIEEQALLIASKDALIEDQSRQLLLLPDFEKVARDKEEAAKLKEFESEALKKQVQLLEQAKEESVESAKASEAAKLALQVDLEALKKELEQVKKPWWKKMFEAPPAGQ